MVEVGKIGDKTLVLDGRYISIFKEGELVWKRAYIGYILPDSNPYSYRRRVRITELSGNTLTDYQVKIVIGAGDPIFAHARSAGEDIRFCYYPEEDMLSYWIEKYDPDAEEAIIWVKVPSIPANSEIEIYMYYGNPTVASASDGDATFEFFDDFEDLSKWSVSGTVVIEDGVARFEAGANGEIVNTSLTLFDDVAWRWRCRVSGDPTTGDFFLRLGAVNDGYWQDWEHDDDYAVWDDVDNVYIIRTTKAHDTNWHVRELARTSSGEFKLWFDDEYIGSATDTTRTSISETAIRNSHDVHAYVDWFFIRKYISPEPSVSVGAEE